MLMTTAFWRALMRRSIVSVPAGPKNDQTGERTIPTRFSRAVRQHLLLNYMNLDYPVMLGIFGSPGEGKTFQLRAILDTMNVEQRSISAADLESDNAGEPGKILLAEYVRASESIASGTPSALVIDDIDTTVGEWANNTGTVNHQQILAQLMHFADRPTVVERLGRVRRVPIFTTGNDFSKIYPPLRRPGRMVSMFWQPTLLERREVVNVILSDLVAPDVVERLMIEFQHRPISFFAQLRILTLASTVESIVSRASLDVARVVREPARYEQYVRAAWAREPDLAADLFKEARRLDATLAEADVSHLQSTPPKENP
jgi:SpoVK/Ycf46/Vps4 family AAA+-type ATPase